MVRWVTRGICSSGHGSAVAEGPPVDRCSWSYLFSMPVYSWQREGTGPTLPADPYVQEANPELPLLHIGISRFARSHPTC